MGGLRGSGDDHHLIDALAAGGIGARNAWPVLLTERDRLPGATSAVLTGLGVSRTFVVRGSIPISDAVLGQVPDGRRIAGTTLYDTAAQLATAFASSVGTGRVVVASGDRYNIIDAQAGGTFGNLTVLTQQDRLTPVTRSWIEDGTSAQRSSSVARWPSPTSRVARCRMLLR